MQTESQNKVLCSTDQVQGIFKEKNWTEEKKVNLRYTETEKGSDKTVEVC